jgi:hypothetical protein
LGNKTIKERYKKDIKVTQCAVVDPKSIQKVILPIKLRSDAELSGPDLEPAYQRKSTKSFSFCLTIS